MKKPAGWRKKYLGFPLSCQRGCEPRYASDHQFGPFRLEPSERKLLRGNELALTPKAFDTLLLLVRNSCHRRRTSSSGSFGPTVSWKRAACPTTSSCCERPWGKIPRSLKRFLGEVTASSGPFDNCRTLSHRP